MTRAATRTGGFTLVEVIVGVSIMLIVFGALFIAFNAMMAFGEHNRMRAYALFLANEHIEMIRALPYDSIGTVAGLPSGTLPQIETITHDGRSYTRRTFIQYVDDSADGEGAGDTLAADYKRIKVELSYTYGGTSRSFSLVTTVAPKSQESLVGAGILRVVVNDADNDPLGLATVHIVNTTVATSVDITTFTNASGIVSFPGAWAGAGYEVTVSKGGYSTAQTYTSSGANPNPSPSPLTVAENSTTEMYFKIDRVSSLDMTLRDFPVRGRLYDDVFDGTLVSTSTNVQVSGGDVTLAGPAGGYAPSGSLTSTPVSPASLGRWVMFRASTTVPAATAVTYVIEYDDGGVFTPVPDVDLPGNGAGFTTTPINLSMLDTTTYTSLRVVATLATTDPWATPVLEEWVLSYLEEDIPRSGEAVAVRGAKTIGTDSGGNPLYKYTQTHTTDGAGRITLHDMEFDEYTITPSMFIAEACPTLPVVLEPDTTYDQLLTAGAASPHAYQVTVVNTLGHSIPYAEVRVQSGATDVTRVTGPCGVAYFSGLADATYHVTAHAEGLSEFHADRSVSGLTVDTITLSP